MNLLVTGGTGFLGSALVPLLAASGHRLRLLQRSAAPEAEARVGGGAAAGIAAGVGVAAAATAAAIESGAAPAPFPSSAARSAFTASSITAVAARYASLRESPSVRRRSSATGIGGPKRISSGAFRGSALPGGRASAAAPRLARSEPSRSIGMRFVKFSK